MLKKFILVSFFSIYIVVLFSQENNAILYSTPTIKGDDELKVIYRNEMTGGILAHTNGFGLNYRRTKHATGYRKRILEFEFVNMKHQKEEKTVNPYFENSKGFFYGKLNTFHVFRPGFGFQSVLFRRAERKSVEIRYIYMLGASVGFVKPVYLEIFKPTGNDQGYISTERYDPAKHEIINSYGQIYGRASFFRGMDEMKIMPGGYGRFGLSFEFGEMRTDVKAIETGVIVDVYGKQVPIMAEAKNNQVFINLYLAFIFGKRWF